MSRGLLAWLEENEDRTGISALAIGELTFGLEVLPEDKKRKGLERSFSFFREDYAGRILDFTEGVAVEWAA